MQKIENIDQMYLIDILLGIIVNKSKPTEDFNESKFYSAMQNVCKNGSREVLEKLLCHMEVHSKDIKEGFIYSEMIAYLGGHKKTDGAYLKPNNDQIMAISDTIKYRYNKPILDKLKEVSKKVWDEYDKIKN